MKSPLLILLSLSLLVLCCNEPQDSDTSEHEATQTVQSENKANNPVFDRLLLAFEQTDIKARDTLQYLGAADCIHGQFVKQKLPKDLIQEFFQFDPDTLSGIFQNMYRGFYSLERLDISDEWVGLIYWAMIEEWNDELRLGIYDRQGNHRETYVMGSNSSSSDGTSLSVYEFLSDNQLKVTHTYQNDFDEEDAPVVFASEKLRITSAGTIHIEKEVPPGRRFPYLSRWKLDEAYLRKCSPKMEALRLMRNEIFAHHGYPFQSQDLMEYFSRQTWYQPSSEQMNPTLTDVEKANVELLRKLEQELKG